MRRGGGWSRSDMPLASVSAPGMKKGRTLTGPAPVLSVRYFTFGNIAGPSRATPDDRGLIAEFEMQGLDILDLEAAFHQAARVAFTKIG
jgi:hypothetical protein